MADGQPTAGSHLGPSLLDQAKPLISFAASRLATALAIGALALVGGLWIILQIMFGQVDSRLEKIDDRMTAMDQRFTAIDGRLAEMIGKVAGLDGYVRAKLDPADFQRLMRRTEAQPEQLPTPALPRAVSVRSLAEFDEYRARGLRVVVEIEDRLFPLQVVSTDVSSGTVTVVYEPGTGAQFTDGDAKLAGLLTTGLTARVSDFEVEGVNIVLRLYA